MFIKGKQDKPYRIAIYGTGGVGKSTLANEAENPLFFDFEDALDHIDCVKTPMIRSMEEIGPYINHGIEEGYKTFVFDTADCIENLLCKKICKEHKIDSIADLGFGKGYEALNTQWNKVMDTFDYLKEKGINSILIAHEIVKRYDDPRTDGYDRILLKMHQKSAGTVISRLDAVLYMCYDYIVSSKKEKSLEKPKPKGNGKRIVFTDERPAFIAKNRYDMPHRLEDVNSIYQFLKNGEKNV